MASIASTEKKTRGKLWPDGATKCLIQLWSEETIQVSLDSCKTSRQTSNVYQILLHQLEEKGYKGYTLKEVINKIKKLRQKYKQEKDKAKRSGNGACKKWKFFNDIDLFLTTRHNVTPPVVVDTMAEDKSEMDNGQVEELDNISDPVDNMVEKYGQGETSVHKCRSCDYEQEIRSGGVHVSEGGSVMVFSSEDEFHCPNCDSNENDQLPSKCSGSDHDSSHEGDPGACEEQLKNAGNEASKEKTPVLPKRKKKTNVEKSLDIVFDKFKQSSATDFERYQKLEEERIKREHEFRIKQMQIESERRKEERQHEMNMLRMILSPPQPPQGVSSGNNFNNPVFYHPTYNVDPGSDITYSNGDATYFKL